jgi:hypothetical protein
VTETFIDSVAARTGQTADEVEVIFLRHSISDAPAPPVARPLRLQRLHFSGQKAIQGTTEPFEFTWSSLKEGVYAIATDSNFAGKSSILQIALWAIRGDRKALTDTVRGWLKRVEADICAGNRQLRVQFEVVNGEPIGTVDILSEKGEASHTLSFLNDLSFKQQMNKLMLEALDLDSIAASREVSTLQKVVPYVDGWTAYTGALLFDSDSSALIGDNVGTDLTQRLLQVFLGLPWATTLFQARSAKRVVESDILARKRQLAQFGGRSVESIQARIRDIDIQIREGTGRDKALEALGKARENYDLLTTEVTDLQGTLTSAEAELCVGDDALIQRKRELLEIEEEQIATSFLGRLAPTCCPRCTRAVDDKRKKAEQTDGKCSVCSNQVETESSIDYDALKADATSKVGSVSKQVEKARRAFAQLREKFEETRKKQLAAAELLQKLAAGGTAAEEQHLRLEKAKLEGVLETIEQLVQTDSGQAADLDVLRHAEDVAKERVEAAAEAVLSSASGLIAAMARKLGMEDVERVTLKRNATMDVFKGGSRSTFSTLSPGERLRVRIATVLALLESAHQHGVGRHPGLLMIDSPAKEEMADANVEEMLSALAKLPTSVPNLQMFVAFRGTDRAQAVFPSERLLIAKGSERLW